MSSVSNSNASINRNAGELLPELIAQIGGHEQRWPITALHDAAEAEAIRQEIVDSSGSVVVQLSNVLDLPDGDRWVVLTFLADLPVGAARYVVDDGDDATDLFVAVLAQMVDNSDIRRCQRGISAAVEAVALLHRDAVVPACSRIKARLDELSVGGQRVDRLVTAVRQVQRTNGHAGDVEHDRPVRMILPDAPVPDEAVIPRRWNLNAEGITQLLADEDLVQIPAPIVISKRFEGVDGADQAVEIAWLRDGRWHSKIVPRGLVATARTIVDLAAFGLPVTSINAPAVVQYLADFETENLSALPRAYYTHRLGWLGENGGDGFLWGRELLPVEVAPSECLSESGDSTCETRSIEFRGADAGDEQLVSGYRATGTFAAWQEAVATLESYPRARLTVIASLATVLLSIVRAPNFVFSLAGATSHGKTTMLRVAASVWGEPDERSPSAVVSTFDSTRVWIEQAAATRTHLPIILDDTKRARRPEDVAQFLYDITAGRGRGRGSTTGVVQSATWTTVAIVSGESPITSFSRDGGTRARVLELWGSPFGDTTTPETAVLAVTINAEVLENFGHAGPEFVRFLIANRSKWPRWKKVFERFRRSYEQRADGNSVAGRLASHGALLHVTGLLAHRAGVLPWAHSDVVSELWGELVSESADADQAAAALRHVWGWACAHEAEFVGVESPEPNQPARGWAGRWDRHAGEFDPTANSAERVMPRWLVIGFVPSRLEEILREAGYEPIAILRLWRNRDWLQLDSDGQHNRRMRLGHGRGAPSMRMVAIRRAAFEEVEECSLDEPREPRNLHDRNRAEPTPQQAEAA